MATQAHKILDTLTTTQKFEEFDTALEAYNHHHGLDPYGVGTAIGYDNTAENSEAQALEWLDDNTVIIQCKATDCDKSHLIVLDF